MKNVNSWKNAIITGASSGLGKEFALQLAKSKTNLLLIALNFEKINKLKNELECQFGIEVFTLSIDLSESNSANEIANFIDEINFNPDLLVNNAGVGIYGSFEESHIDEEKNLININILSLTVLSKLICLKMITNGYGTILNVSSTLSFRKSAFWSVYAASKAYIFSFTRNLSFEFRNSNIVFSVLCPGKTNTSFDENAKYFKSVNKKKDSPAFVVNYALVKLRKKQTLIIPGIINKIKYMFFKYCPDFITDIIIK